MELPNEARRRLGGDGGAVLLETALALPILFAFLMVLFDFSMLELKQSQLTSASRDGARAGIITWIGADTGSYSGGPCPASPASYSAICDAVLKRLAGATATSITAACYVGSTTTTEACTKANVTEGIDTLQVTVTYSYVPVTPPAQLVLGSGKSFTSSTRMVIQ